VFFLSNSENQRGNVALQSRAFFYSHIFKLGKSKRHKKGKKIHNYNQGNQRAPHHTLAGRNQISFSPGAPFKFRNPKSNPSKKGADPTVHTQLNHFPFSKLTQAELQLTARD
jgi:hypothetical protein